MKSEPYGWSVRLCEGVTTHFRSLERALREAEGLSQALRRHGEATSVVIDDTAPGATPRKPDCLAEDRSLEVFQDGVFRATAEPKRPGAD